MSESLSSTLANKTFVLRLVDADMQSTLRSYMSAASAPPPPPPIVELLRSSSSGPMLLSTQPPLDPNPNQVVVNFVSGGAVYAHVKPLPNTDPTLWQFFMPLPSSSSSRGGGGGGGGGPSSLAASLDGSSAVVVAAYPARLVNLPTVVEVHKTFPPPPGSSGRGTGGSSSSSSSSSAGAASHYHKSYVKAADVGQMIIVYKDDASMQCAEKKLHKSAQFPGYYPSGLTPPAANIPRRFKDVRRPPYPPGEVSLVENYLLEVLRVHLGVSVGGPDGPSGGVLSAPLTAGGRKRRPGKGAGTRSMKHLGAAGLVTTEVEDGAATSVEEEVVDYEPWMDDFGRGRVGNELGVEFNEGEELAILHPEIWLTGKDVRVDDHKFDDVPEGIGASYGANDAILMYGGGGGGAYNNDDDDGYAFDESALQEGFDERQW